MATYPLATLAPTIDANGITAVSYDDILASLKASFQSIYGSDAYIEADSQDGQMLAIYAKGIYDCGQACVAVYNSFAPSSAQGVNLSRLVKINGLTRSTASNSQVVLTLTGDAGTVITAGKVRDAGGFTWDLPAVVTLDPSGLATVTATCETSGAIAAPIGTVTQISTPTRGWQSVTNPSSASLGAAVESDAVLRQRQATSTARPSQTILTGLSGALLELNGVTQVRVYENDTNATDANGLPEHSIACVVQGGDSLEIAQTILARKTPGCYTHGTTSVALHDSVGVPYTIRYFVPTDVRIRVAITMHAFAGYSTSTADAIKAALVDYINALPFGQDVLLPRLYLPAQLFGGAGSDLYELVTLQTALGMGSFGTSDIAIAYNEQATLVTADVGITLV